MKKYVIFYVLSLVSYFGYSQYSSLTLTGSMDQIRFEPSGYDRYWFMSKPGDGKAFALYSPDDGGGWFTYWKLASGDMIMNRGRLGIGVSTPSEKLEVNGNIALDNYYITSLGGSKIGFGAANFGNEDDDITIDVVSDGELEIRVTNTDAINVGGGFLNLGRNGGFNVGIGTNTPSEKLEVNGNIALDNFYITSQGGSKIGFGTANFGNEDDDITIDVASDGELEVRVTNTDALNIGNGLLTLGRNGDFNVGIGTTTASEKLEVNGTIRSKEVKVEASPWPDYVFDEAYDLKSLAETEQYIKENKHLPNLPSAEEVSENGIELGEMNAKLLEKIEELTLHQIEMMKLIKLQQREIENLKLK